MPALVKFPRDKAGQQADRDAWPWVNGVIEQWVGEDEWQVRGVTRGRHGRRWHARAGRDAG